MNCAIGSDDAVPEQIPPNSPSDAPEAACKNPTFQNDGSAAGQIARQQQAPLDLIDEASMESFPCSDPPASTTAHS